MDAQIFLKLIDYDKSKVKIAAPLEQENIPLRELMIRYTVCHSQMEIGQRNINFGTLDKKEHRSKRIVIRNQSEAPLYYKIQVSGSIASGDLKLSHGAQGIIRGYGTREVEFEFRPSLSGAYHERLIVENLQNPENSQVLVVKAFVRLPENFFIAKSELDFQTVYLDQPNFNVQDIVISNPSATHYRVFEVKVESELKSKHFMAEIQLVMADEELLPPDDSTQQSPHPRMMLSKEAEEKIEQLQQKLKIAERKGRKDKMVKITEQLEQLQSGVVVPEDETQSGDLSLENSTSLDKRFSETKRPNSATLPKTKKTDTSIVFSIGPRCIRTVMVRFRPISHEFTASTVVDNQEENITLDFFVHEQKNVDIRKQVTFAAKIILQHQSNDVVGENSLASSIIRSDSRMASTILTEESGQSRESSVRPLAESLEPAKLSIPFVTSVVEFNQIDLGRLEVDEWKECYFTACNRGQNESTVEIRQVEHSSAKFKFQASSYILKPGQILRIDLAIRPSHVGQKFGLFEIVDSQTREVEPIYFMFLGICKHYLSFSMGFAYETSPELEFGYCFADPSKRYGLVRCLKVKNVWTQELYLTSTSNLTQQCFIFTDAELQVPATEVLINPDEIVNVYVALQPNFLITGIASKISEAFEVRELIGGLKFKVFIKDGPREYPVGITSCKTTAPQENSLVYLLTQTLKFTTTIGQSCMSVSTQNIKFGAISEKGTVLKDGFWVTNISAEMPLDFELTTDDPAIRTSVSKMRIEPIRKPVISSSRGVWVDVSFDCLRYGFYYFEVKCTNLNNSFQQFKILVSAFLDPKTIQMRLHQTDGGVIIPETDQTITWEDIYLSVCPEIVELNGPKQYILNLEKKASCQLAPTYEKSFDIFNSSNELLHLRPISFTNVSVKWRASNGFGFVVEPTVDMRSTDAKFAFCTISQALQLCGPSLILQPQSRAQITVLAPQPRPTDEVGWQQLITGSRIRQSDILLIQDLDKGEILKCIDLDSTYCMSIANVSPEIIDLGRVGHCNMWRETIFTFSIQNVADIPFLHEIDHPDFVSEPISTNKKLGSKRIIGPKETEVFESSFDPRKAHNSFGTGSNHFKLAISNMFNPSNQMIVKFQYFMTEFDLKFERLTSGQLVLPSLTYPSPSGSLPCENWFTIANSSEKAVTFDVGFSLSPDFTSLVGLEVLSRVYNVPIGNPVVLGPKEVAEIKIRAVALESTRLFSKDPRTSYLTKEDGVTLGTISVSLNEIGSNLGDDVVKVVEKIPLRGIIVEGKSFSLSTRRIEFSSGAWNSEQSINNDSVMKAQPIIVTNLLPGLPLDFRVAIEYPIEFSSEKLHFLELSPIGPDMCGTVPPGKEQLFNLSLLNLLLDEISDDVKIHFYDLNASSRQVQTVAVSIVEGEQAEIESAGAPDLSNTEDLLTNNMGESFHSDMQIEGSPTSPAVLADNNQRTKYDSAAGTNKNSNMMVLKGCKRLYDSKTGEFMEFYELDLGQQDLSSTQFTKKISLENCSNSSIEYRLKTVATNGPPWMSCSRTDGILEPGRGQRFGHSICLTFQVSIRGVWSSYLIIENLESVSDTKIIRIKYEVVAKQNLRRSLAVLDTTSPSDHQQISAHPTTLKTAMCVFGVKTHILSAKDGTIDLGNICYGEFDTRHSFIISNNEPVPAEFTMKSNISPESGMEICFSTSRSMSKLFKSIVIRGESQLKVYIKFWPGDIPSCDTEPQNLQKKIALDIYINCRLVKDFQHVIPMTATCFVPQMHISQSDISFYGKCVGADFELSTQSRQANTSAPEQDTFVICNMGNLELEYEVYSDSELFSLVSNVNSEPISIQCYKSSSWTVAPGARSTLKVVPIMAAISKHLVHIKKVIYLMQERYLMEHFVLYNPKRPHERHVIQIYLNFGRLPQFQVFQF